MVAGRLLDLRLPFVFPLCSRAARPTMSGPEVFVQGFEANLQAQAAMIAWVDQTLMMGAGAVARKATFHMGGQAISMIYGRSKEMFSKEDFNALVETYNLTNSVSMVATPIVSPDKRVTEQGHQKNWVAKEVVRLNK